MHTAWGCFTFKRNLEVTLFTWWLHLKQQGCLVLLNILRFRSSWYWYSEQHLISFSRSKPLEGGATPYFAKASAVASSTGGTEPIGTLEWWKNNSTDLLYWSTAAQKVFLVQPSSAAAEYVFSIPNWFSDTQTNSLEDYVESSHGSIQQPKDVFDVHILVLHFRTQYTSSRDASKSVQISFRIHKCVMLSCRNTDS